MKTYYEILGVKETASNKEIKSAYKTLMKKYHPDVFKGDASSAQKISAEINNAYDILSNSQQRKEYDQQLKEQREAETTKYYTYQKYSSTADTSTHQRTSYRKESAQDIYNRILKNQRTNSKNYTNSYSYSTINKAQNYMENKLSSLNRTQLLLVVLAVILICLIGLIISIIDLKNVSKIKSNRSSTSNSSSTEYANTYYYPSYNSVQRDETNNNNNNNNNLNTMQTIMDYYGFDLFFDNEYDFQMFMYENSDLLEDYLRGYIKQDEYFKELYQRAETKYN